MNPRISTTEFESFQVKTLGRVDQNLFFVLRQILYRNNAYI